MFVGMADLLKWTEIGAKLADMPRGSRTRLAEILHMDRSQLARHLKTTDFPKANQARLIEQFLEGREIVLPEHPSFKAPDTGVQRVPLYGFAAGSEGDRIAMNDGAILDWVDLPRGMSLKGEFFIVQLVGHSMEPRIWAGERKLCQRNVPPARDQDAVVEFNDGTGLLKTYKRQKDGHLFVGQYNPAKELTLDATKVKALHAVFPL